MFIHVGVLTYGLGGTVALAYVLLTPHGPHRGALLLLDLVSLACWLGIFWWVGLRLVATKWRTPFFATWTLSTFTFIAVGAVLDGGIRSPMSYFLVLPLVFAGLGYPPRTVTTLTAAGAVAGVVVGALTSHPSFWTTVLLATSIVVAGSLAISTARLRQRLINTLVDTASRDGLTGCLTRRAFYERLDHEVARCRRYDGRFSIILADIDDLKMVNDRGGHQAGDDAIKAVAHSLRELARHSDLVGRLGGDEFVLLLPRATAAEAEAVGQRLLEAIRAIPDVLTASLGVAEWDSPSEPPDVLMRRADLALYRAKREGRDRSLVGDAPRQPLRVVTDSTRATGA